MSLFEVAILEETTSDERNDGFLEKLVFGPKAIIAKDTEHAKILAIMELGDTKVNKARIRVLFRFFG